MKTKYSKQLLSGLVGVIFLIGIGLAGYIQPVYAASSDDTNKTEKQLKEPSAGKKKSRTKNDSAAAKPESVVDKSPRKEKTAEAGGTAALPDESEEMESAGRMADDNAEDADLPEKAVQSGKLVLNFENADLSEVIRTFAELLNITYLLDKGVSGNVTIHTAGELNREDLFPVFYQILEINGVTAVKDGNIYKIVPLKDASREPIVTRTGRDARVPEGERVVIQVIPLDSVSAQEMGKILTPFISQDGVIVSQENRNIIVVVDKADNISKVLRLVKVFDTDVFERVGHRFYHLEFGDVESIVELMDKLFLSYGEAVKADVNLIPITRLNTLLVVSANPRVFDEIEYFIEQYDVPSQSMEPGIYVYSLKNSRAADVADILGAVFTGKKDTREKQKDGDAPSEFRNPLGKEAKLEKAEKKEPPRAIISGGAASPGSDVSVGSGTLRGEINITADESRNSLIIEAAPADYQIIKNLLKQLDIMPRQVVIEVTIAEITLDESTAMGVEWSYVKGSESLSSSLLKATMGDSGLNFTVGNPDRWTAALSALATDNKVNILSNPSVLASNSLPATIDISQEIPIASSQYQYTTGDDALLETDIEYRDTGIMLSVTPNINEQGLVTMDIDQEISEQSTNVSVGGEDYPSFFKRNVNTTLTVQSGQTIVIGGLIRETTSDGASGTPWFTGIPVLNFLFGKTSDSISKTELIILISPYVIATPDDVDAVTREFTNKLSALFLKSE